jgi:hypothetical protein
MKAGHTFDLNRQLAPERIARIERAIAQAVDGRLTQVKALLPQDFTYYEIRLVANQVAQRKSV